MRKILFYLRNVAVPPVAWLLITAISSSLRFELVNRDIVESLKKEGRKIVYIFWHGRQFLTVYAHRKMKIAILTSLSKDGDMQTAILERFGYKCLRGSSTRGGMQALREMIRAMRSGYDCAFAADGPKGPIYEVKPGALFLAQVNGAAVIPVACSAEKKKIFEKAWDKYELPLPFSRARIIYGKPLYIGREDDISLKAAEVSKALRLLTEKADFWG